MSHMPSFISLARDVSPPECQTQTQMESVIIPGPIRASQFEPCSAGWSESKGVRLSQLLMSGAGAAPSFQGPLSLPAQ